jgi:hypothetical protein
MSKKQTAIQQLIGICKMDYNNGVEISMKVFLKMLNDYKEMEKHQIIDAYNEGHVANKYKADAEQYYNETFNK